MGLSSLLHRFWASRQWRQFYRFYVHQVAPVILSPGPACTIGFVTGASMELIKQFVWIGEINFYAVAQRNARKRAPGAFRAELEMLYGGPKVFDECWDGPALPLRDRRDGL